MSRLFKLLLLQQVIAVSLFAAPPGSVEVDSSISFDVDTSVGSVTCAFVSDEFIPGRVLSDNVTFLSCQAELKTLKTKNKKNPKPSLKAKIKKLKTKKIEGDILCVDDSPPPPTNPSVGNFDLLGNVTAQGKINFGIPSSLSANIDQGKTIYNSMCDGCHGPKLNFTFPEYRTKIKEEPMYFDEEEVPDTFLANLTAYLNRFNLP